MICSGVISCGIESQTVGPAPQHRALTGGVIDEDVGGLVGAVLANLHVVEIDALAEQAFHLNLPALVVADGADVLDAKPSLAQATIALAT